MGRKYVCLFVRLFLHLSICMFVHLTILLFVHPSSPSRAQEPARQALDPASQASEPASQARHLGLPGWLSGLLGPSKGNGWTDGWMDGWMENLPILQDFVSYRGHCPASPMKTKEKVEQGKGTADHLKLAYSGALASIEDKVL